MAPRMPSSAQERDIFIREVDEGLREERLHWFWKRYSHLILSMILAIVIMVAGHEAWKQWQTQQAAAYALRYDEAVVLTESDRAAEGLAMLAALATEAGGGYRAIAALRQAVVLARRGELAIALAVWRKVAADLKIPRPYREAAILLSVLNSVGRVEPSELTVLLEPLTVDTNPWRFSALELTAVLAMQRNDVATARTILSQLADNPQAPAGVRSRTEALRQCLFSPTTGR